MNKVKSIAFAFLSVLLVSSCQESTPQDSEVSTNSDPETENTTPTIEEEETEQTVDERVIEIKALYAKIQASANQEKNCNSNTETDVNYDIIEEGFVIENKAKECQLEDGLMYQQVKLNGYEWGETCTFYYKENKRFFTYLTGGAEACGYDYRVYYDKEGEVIRVLLAENECDGQDVSASVEVTDEKRKEEILSSVARAEKEFKSILQ